MLMSRLRTTDGRNAKIGLEFWNRIRNNCSIESLICNLLLAIRHINVTKHKTNWDQYTCTAVWWVQQRSRWDSREELGDIKVLHLIYSPLLPPNIKTPACKNKNFANKNKNFATPTSKNWLISWKLYVSVPLAKYYSFLSMHWSLKNQILPANARNSTAQDQRKSSSMFVGE